MPGVYGEYEANAGILRRRKCGAADVLSVVGRKAGNVLSNMAAVACAREIEYHSVRRAFVGEGW